MAENPLHRVLYVSSARESVSSASRAGKDIFSRARNVAIDITGALLYADGNFMQLLEGPRDAVLATLARIEKNPLHSGVIVLINGPAAARQFDAWSMAYSQATWEEMTEVRNACRTSNDSAVLILKGFATNTSRFRIGAG